MTVKPVRALTKTIKNGQTATVDIEWSTLGCFVTVARLDGKEIGNHMGPHHAAYKLPAGHVAAIGKLALTADEAAQIETAYRAQEKGVGLDLVQERRQLIARIGIAEDAWSAHRAHLMDTDMHRLGEGDTANEAEIFLARQALSDFDTAHPEIAVQAMAEQQAKTDEAIRRAFED